MEELRIYGAAQDDYEVANWLSNGYALVLSEMYGQSNTVVSRRDGTYNMLWAKRVDYPWGGENVKWFILHCLIF